MIFYPGGMSYQVRTLEQKLSRAQAEREEMSKRLTKMERNLTRIVDAYKKLNPMRTADVHSLKCKCLRCMIDDAEVLVKRK